VVEMKRSFLSNQPYAARDAELGAFMCPSDSYRLAERGNGRVEQKVCVIQPEEPGQQAYILVRSRQIEWKNGIPGFRARVS